MQYQIEELCRLGAVFAAVKKLLTLASKNPAGVKSVLLGISGDDVAFSTATPRRPDCE
jgi:hypothetical protein